MSHRGDQKSSSNDTAVYVLIFTEILELIYLLSRYLRALFEK